MNLVAQTLAQAFAPDVKLTVSQWAEKYRVLSPVATSEAGPWRTDRVPYTREIMDALSVTSPVTRVVLMKGSQVAGSELGNNWLGYIISHAPAPSLVLFPTDGTAEDNVRTRIDPLIENTACVRDRIPHRGSKDGGNTSSRKDFPGGFLAIRGANSPSKLRSLPIRFLFGDEIDAYEVTGEGDPIQLAQRRTATFGPKRKEYYVSTPTLESTSRIQQLFEATDQRRYFVPCPHCGDYQLIQWKSIHWDSPESAPYLVCEPNGCVIAEHHKTEMLARGQWRATAECSDPHVRGYHLSALYSPLGWFSWGQARDMFLSARKNPSLLQVFVNTVLGETWATQGEAPDWERLYGRRGGHVRNFVPREGLVLTAAADIQRDRIEVEIRAWGESMRSWSIDHRVIPGDPAQLNGPHSPWLALDALLSESWEHELGGRIAISKLGVDSGDGQMTQVVYTWSRRHPSDRVVPVKGSATASTLVSPPKLIDTTVNGIKVPNGAVLSVVGVNLAKSELYGWLRQSRLEDPKEPLPTGWMHWPGDYENEWFRQLTAEQLVTKTVKGFRRSEWVKIRERNEALDLHVYNRAMAALVGVDRFTPRRWDFLRSELTVDGKPHNEVLSQVKNPEAASKTSPSPEPVRAGKRKVKRIRSSWWD